MRGDLHAELEMLDHRDEEVVGQIEVCSESARMAIHRIQGSHIKSFVLADALDRVDVVGEVVEVPGEAIVLLRAAHHQHHLAHLVADA